jgi:hypothetical protein
MKTNRFLLVCGLVALPQLAIADQPADPEPLALVRSLLNYCSKVDPGHAQVFSALWKDLVSRVPSDQAEGGGNATPAANLKGTTDFGAPHVCSVLASSSGKSGDRGDSAPANPGRSSRDDAPYHAGAPARTERGS